MCNRCNRTPCSCNYQNYCYQYPPSQGPQGPVGPAGPMGPPGPPGSPFAYVRGGNAFGLDSTIGLTDNFALSVITNNTTRMHFTANGLIGMGTIAPDSSSVLDMSSTSRGTLVPRMTTVQRNAIVAPATGLLVYDITVSLFSYFDGAIWQYIDSTAGGDVSGSGTTNYIMKWTNGPGSVAGDSMVFDNGAFVGIGTNVQFGTELLAINGDAYINGKLTVTGVIDPTAMILSGGTSLYYESNDGQTAPVSGASTGRIRYNNPTGTWQVSTQTSVYSDIITAATLPPGIFLNGGNSFGGNATLGTNDAFDLLFETSGTEVARFTTTGRFGIGTTSPTGVLQVNSSGTTLVTHVAQFLNGNGNIFDLRDDDQCFITATTSFYNRSNSDTISISTNSNVIDMSRASGERFQIRQNGNNLVFNAISADRNYDFQTNGTSLLYMDGVSKMIGINNTSPSHQLQVTASVANSVFRFEDSTAVYSLRMNSAGNIQGTGAGIVLTSTGGPDIQIIAASGSDLRLQTGGGNYLLLATDGGDITETVAGSVTRNITGGYVENSATRNINISGTSDYNITMAGDHTFTINTNKYILNVVGGSGNFTETIAGTETKTITGLSTENINGNKAFLSGRVGIGLTSPSAKLHVKGEGTTAATQTFYAENSTGGSYFYFRDDGAALLVVGAASGGGFNTTLSDGTAYRANGDSSQTIGLLASNCRVGGQASIGVANGYGFIGSVQSGVNATAIFGENINSGNSGIFQTEDGGLGVLIKNTSSAITANSSNDLCQIRRLSTLGAFDLTGAVLYIDSTVADTGKLLHINKQGSDVFIVNASKQVVYGDTVDLVFNTGTGSKIGTATNQKISFWNATPIVQPTTAVAAATFVANTSGIADDSATFDGYTIGQVVKALRNTGLLA